MSLKNSFVIYTSFVVLSLFLSGCSTKPTVISYSTADQQTLKADLFLPAEIKSIPMPLVIVIHGGGWSNRTGDMASICQRLNKNGFAALNITYRFAPNYHHPMQVNDVKAVIPWLIANAEKFNIDKNKISAWGYSAGAHLAFLLVNQPDLGLKFKAVVVGGIPSYFPTYPKSPLITEYMGMKYFDNPKAWLEASPTTFVSAQSPPTFIYHGIDDSFDHLFGVPTLARAFKEAYGEGEEFVTVSPDAGGVERARAFSKRIGSTLAIIDKRRTAPGESKAMHLIGDVAGKTAVIVDDMIDTAGTLTQAVDSLLKNGAKQVFALATHAVFSGPAINRLQESAIAKVFVTDTIPLSEQAKSCSKIQVISVAGVLAEAIRRIHDHDSVSSLFD